MLLNMDTTIPILPSDCHCTDYILCCNDFFKRDFGKDTQKKVKILVSYKKSNYLCTRLTAIKV